jgi:hypothetical protein
MATLPRSSGNLSIQTEGSQHSNQSQNGESDFDADHAALLRDIARDGTGAPDVEMYGYHDTGSNGVHLNGYGDGGSGSMHSNGVDSTSDFAYPAEYTYHETVPTQQELDALDPAALLESLANFEHPPSNNNAPISNDHFASLLQAAATAGGQESQVDSNTPKRTTRRSRAAEQLGFSPSSPIDNRSTRNRTTSSDVLDEPTFVTSRITKRKRVIDPIDEEEQLRREHEIWGPEEPEDGDDLTFETTYDHPPIGPSSARALGVHSAAALFRRPSTASKKYTSNSSS